MSPRPRKASDEDIFAATRLLMSRVGPRELSLAAIAAESGVTAGALVQRFGSKRKLLLAVVEGWSEDTREVLEDVRAQSDSALAAIKSYAKCIATMGQQPGALAHHLAYLQMDLTDPDFQQHMRRSAEVAYGTLTGWIAEAVETGELGEATEISALARLVEATLSGSLLTWAVYQEGPATDWVLRDINALLAPHLSQRATS